MTCGSSRAGRLTGLLAAASLGCASAGVEVREYVLTPVASAGPDMAGGGDLSIDVGPVVMPHYLRRSQIVTRVGANELRASDTHRWGEDLDRGLARVVAENLAGLVPAGRVRAFPWRDSAQGNYRVAIEAKRFESSQDGSVTLETRWELLRSGESSPIAVRNASFVEASAGSGYVACVDAMSRAAGRLSREIAAAIQADAGLGAAE